MVARISGDAIIGDRFPVHESNSHHLPLPRSQFLYQGLYDLESSLAVDIIQYPDRSGIMQVDQFFFSAQPAKLFVKDIVGNFSLNVFNDTSHHLFILRFNNQN
jgi:hypothetical protein